MIETKRTAVLSEITEIPLRLLTREILHKLGVLELNMLFTEQVNVCLTLYTLCLNKKDGYRQQNVRQRQKLISIIDYAVCILEYLQPFWRFSTSKNGLTLKSGYVVLKVIEKGAVR